jgi:hypothetical protein
MKVRTLRTFNDLETDTIRNAREIFEATEERVEQINSTSNGVLVEMLEEPQKKASDGNVRKNKTGNTNKK